MAMASNYSYTHRILRYEVNLETVDVDADGIGMK